MTDLNSSFVRLGDDGENAPVLKYSIPEPNSYFFRNIIPLDVPEKLFDPEKVTTSNRSSESAAANSTAIAEAKSDTGIFSEEDMYNQMKMLRAINEGWITVKDGIVEPGGPSVGSKPNSVHFGRLLSVKAEPFNELYSKEAMRRRGSQFYYMEGIYEINGVRIVPPKKTTVKPQLLIIESYQLSNYRGNYGAGGVIKTHSLAPGEKNKFFVKTYKKTTEVKNEGSSILDSNTRQAASDFEESFEREQSNKYTTLETDLKNSERGEGSVNVVGIFGGSGSYERTGHWGTRSERDAFAKAVGKALYKHSYRASSKRNVEVNFSSESTAEEGFETSIEREVENINVSRTLNLVFRQMVQEYISVLHLVDIKLAVYDGTYGPYPEYSFYELDKLFDDYFIDDATERNVVRLKLLREFYHIHNYRGEAIQLLEKVVNFEIPAGSPAELGFEAPIEYWRVKKPLQSEVEDLPKGVSIPGIVIDVSKITMRTEGVIMDAFLGLGEGLDNYSKGLQTEAVRERELENNKLQKALDIIDSLTGNERAEAFERMFRNKAVDYTIKLDRE